MSGWVVELFSGIQGEGVHVGRRHLFLRLAGCNLACDYCDQPEARRAPRRALIERTAGRRDFARVANPMDAAALARAVGRLCRTPGLHQALALTGGEPLMQAAFLAELLPRLRPLRLPVLLETNGTRVAECARLRGLIDIVSMDFKLPSATGRPMPEQAHAAFLRAAVRQGGEVYVKAVVARDTTEAEIRRVARAIAKVKDSVPLILQPVTPRGARGPKPPAPEALLRLQECAARSLRNVRVIPQTHKIVKQR